jgi:lipopolysaccharide biosynthesis regulator YciM
VGSIPWSPADRAADDEQPIIRTFLTLLEMVTGRYTLSEVLGFARENHRETVRVLKSLGDVWRHRGRQDKARDFYQHALQIAQTIQDDKLAQRLLLRLELVNNGDDERSVG